MNRDHRLKALEVETEFLAGAEANLEAAKGQELRGTIWNTARFDEASRLRGLMKQRGLFDEELYNELPHNRRVAMHGFERRWWGGKRRTGLAVATVLAPLDAYLEDDDTAESPPPVGLDQLVDHVRSLVVDDKVPHVIGVCSPSGFTPEALRSGLDLPGVTLVLIEPREDGGWRTHGVSQNAKPNLCRLFDPEATAQKLKRVHEEIERRSADLLGGGLSVPAIAARLELPKETVAQAFRHAAVADPELKISRQSGEAVLFRGAPLATQENASMSVADHLRKLFGVEGDEPRKINALTEQRVALTQRRDRIYDDVAKIEKKESALVEEGRTTKSPAVRRRVAAQVAQIRKELERHNTSATMLNQQINIVATHIHNLTLTQRGQMAKLPEAEELTDVAVQAEEMLESLKADADLADSLETGMAESQMSDEELAILKEFETPEPEAGETTDEASTAAPEAEPEAGDAEPTRRRGEAEAS